MWLFTGQGYAGVLRKLLENFPRRVGERWTRPAHTGSAAKARARRGAAPPRRLFDQVVGAQGTPATLGAFRRGRRLLSLDGTLFDVPDGQAGQRSCFQAEFKRRQARPVPPPGSSDDSCGARHPCPAGAAFGSFAAGQRPSPPASCITWTPAYCSWPTAAPPPSLCEAKPPPPATTGGPPPNASAAFIPEPRGLRCLEDHA